MHGIVVAHGTVLVGQVASNLPDSVAHALAAICGRQATLNQVVELEVLLGEGHLDQLFLHFDLVHFDEVMCARYATCNQIKLK